MMDQRRFDQIAWSFAAGSNRRQLLRGLLGLGGAAVVGTVVSGKADAARRLDNPTPAPVRCPGRQIVVNGTCTCPTGFDACGPDCCPQGSAVCCDNACCYGTCYGEELCCTGVYCEAGGCCGAGQVCCADSGCCDGVCYRDPATGQELCCATDRYCAASGDCCGDGAACCTNDGCCQGECYNDSQGANRCCPSGSGAVCGNECCAPAAQVCCEQADGARYCAPIEVGCGEPECQADMDCGIGKRCCNGVCARCCNDDDCLECQACVAGNCSPNTAHPCGDICCDTQVEGVCCIHDGYTTGICCPLEDAYGNEFERCCGQIPGNLSCGYPCCDNEDCGFSNYCLEGRCVDCLEASQCSLSQGSLGQLCCDNTCYEGDCCTSGECRPGEQCLGNVCRPVTGP
jgi:hypothetical protein